jgi:acyl transferase domain-containing protein
VLDELRRAPADFRLLSEPARAQPVLTALQIALARLLLARGVDVAAVTGLSMGEVAGAHIAGALSLADAMTVVCTQSRLAARGPAGTGMMAWVAAGADELADAGALASGVHVAIALAPRLTVVSGRAGTVERLLERLQGSGVACGSARLGDAYHSPAVAPLEQEFRAPLARIASARTNVPLYSSVTGARIDGAGLAADHWWAVMRRPASFLCAAQAALADGHRRFIEVGPHPVLAEPLRQTAADQGRTIAVTCTMERQVDDVATFEAALPSPDEVG